MPMDPVCVAVAVAYLCESITTKHPLVKRIASEYNISAPFVLDCLKARVKSELQWELEALAQMSHQEARAYIEGYSLEAVNGSR